MNEFYDLADFSAEEIETLLALSTRLQTHPEPRSLEGKVLALLFMSPSLRTLASFQAAQARKHTRINLAVKAFVLGSCMPL